MSPTTKTDCASPSLRDTLERYRVRVERALDACLPTADTSPQRLHQAMRYATLNGGKRLRATLVYATGETVGANLANLDAPACAVELIHAYSLVHDDLPSMDNDDLRRGKPTCHKAYDEATAILVGDTLHTLAFEILSSGDTKGIDPKQRLRWVETLAQATGSNGMAGGQVVDLESVGKPVTLAQLEDMHHRKTGALIRASVRMGTLTVDPLDPVLTAALDKYALAIGLAFQIVDDVLDVEGDVGNLGKTPGADQARRKPTYPALLGVEESMARARALEATALENLAPLGDNGALLAALAGYVVERTQ